MGYGDHQHASAQAHRQASEDDGQPDEAAYGLQEVLWKDAAAPGTNRQI